MLIVMPAMPMFTWLAVRVGRARLFVQVVGKSARALRAAQGSNGSACQ